MLDNLVSDRVEKWKNKALFERKSAALRELNKELEQEARELDVLLKKKKEMYDLSGKEEDQDDMDAEDFSLNDTCDANESVEDIERRAERLAVRLRVRETEGTIDAITRDLDLLNTDLEDLAQQLDTKELNACTGTPLKSKKNNSGKNSSETNWEEIGREIIANFSLPQCQELLWEQIGEKAALLEQIRAGQFEQQEAEEEAKAATTLADNVSRQLGHAKADLQNRLHRAEKQRVQDVWALLRTQSKEPGTSVPLSDGEASSAVRVAIQRAQDLEGELEVYISSEDRLSQENESMAARIASLEAEILKTTLRAQMSESSVRDAPSRSSDEGSAGDCFETLSCVWDSLGVNPDDRSKAVSDIQKAGLRARENALQTARDKLSYSTEQTKVLERNLTLIAASLGQTIDSFFGDNALAGASATGTVSEKLQSLPALPRLSALRSAVDSATAVMTVRSSGLEKLRERLLDIIAEMWLDNKELPQCLQDVVGVDFLAASVAANQAVEEMDEDSSDEVDEIATFMVTSALCVAQQLEKNRVTLTESNTSLWEKEMRALNVMRAKLTTQMVAVRADTAAICSSLNLDSDALLAIISEGSVSSPAQDAAVELVVAPAVSNPPGSQTLLAAVSSIKKTLENVKSDRSLASAIGTNFSKSLMKILSEDEGHEDPKNSSKEEDSLEMVFSSIGDVRSKAQSVKDTLIAQMTGLLRQGAGAPVVPDVAAESIHIAALLNLKLNSHVPSAVCGLERDLRDLETLVANSKDRWMTHAINRILSGWGDFSGGQADDSTARVIVMQVNAMQC
jgi:hypothetical protein